MNSETEFVKECRNQFEDSFNRLFHCLKQLDDKQVLWVPNEKMNSISVLVKHICGNLRQWILTPVNNEEDNRNRPEEFVNNAGITRADLISFAANLQSDFMVSINSLDNSRLTEQKRVQGYEITLMASIFRSLVHLEGHIGEIVLMTRIQLGSNYKIFWEPQTEEQRSAPKSK